MLEWLSSIDDPPRFSVGQLGTASLEPDQYIEIREGKDKCGSCLLRKYVIPPTKVANLQ